MRFVRQYRFALAFLALLVFCSVMVIRQFNVRQSKHVELREAMILLQTGGYTNEAQTLYRRLLLDLDQLTNKQHTRRHNLFFRRCGPVPCYIILHRLQLLK